MEPFILWLSRLPKTSIASILGAINTFLVARGYIGADTATLVATILIGLGFTVNIVTLDSKVQKIQNNPSQNGNT